MLLSAKSIGLRWFEWRRCICSHKSLCRFECKINGSLAAVMWAVSTFYAVSTVVNNAQSTTSIRRMLKMQSGNSVGVESDGKTMPFWIKHLNSDVGKCMRSFRSGKSRSKWATHTPARTQLTEKSMAAHLIYGRHSLSMVALLCTHRSSSSGNGNERKSQWPGQPAETENNRCIANRMHRECAKWELVEKPMDECYFGNIVCIHHTLHVVDVDAMRGSYGRRWSHQFCKLLKAVSATARLAHRIAGPEKPTISHLVGIDASGLHYSQSPKPKIKWISKVKNGGNINCVVARFASGTGIWWYWSEFFIQQSELQNVVDAWVVQFDPLLDDVDKKERFPFQQNFLSNCFDRKNITYHPNLIFDI